MARKIDITHRTIIFTAVFIFAIWFVYQIREILFNLFIAFILMSALSPLVERLAKHKVPRVLTVIAVYAISLIFVGLVVAGIVPPLVEQTSALIGQIPELVAQVNIPWLDQSQLMAQFSGLGSVPEHILRLSVGVFVNIFNITVMLVLTLYMLLERKNWETYAAKLFDEAKQEKVIDLLERIEGNLGHWVRIELFLMTLIGAMSYLGLRLMNIDFALPLAILAGLLEIVPNVGPTLAAFPAVIAGLTISPSKGLMVALLYIAIQQIENDFIVPRLMQKGLQFNPLLVLVTLAAGLKLGGVGGMALAVPILVVLRELFREFIASGRSIKL